jgi:alpha-L-fucosidase
MTACGFVELIRHLQPATLVNDRLGMPGDYETPEQFIPKRIPTKDVRISAIDTSINETAKSAVPRPEDFQLWETCMTINNQWAYNLKDRDFKSAQFLIRGLVEVASRGGNFLLNVGPRPDGTIQPEFQERLRAIGDWLSVNSDSIYGTTYGPVQGMDSIRTTAKGNKVFIHVFDWSSAVFEIGGIKPKVLSAHLLATGRSLKFTQTEEKLTLDLSSQMPEANVTTITLMTS